MAGWIQMFRGLGESLIEVLRAEVATLQDDFNRSGRNLGQALAFFGTALILLFWIVGLLIFVFVAVLAVWLQLWAAALIVLAFFILGASILGWIGWRHMKNVENPMQTVRRRVDDHLDWWQNGLLREMKTVDVAPDDPTGAGPRVEEDLP